MAKKHKTIKLTELEFDYLYSIIWNKIYFDNLDGWIDDVKENQALERIIKKFRKTL